MGVTTRGIFPQAVDTIIQRSALIAAMNVGTNSEQNWQPIGWHNPDSVITVDIDTDTQKDILGNVFTNSSIPELSQEFDPLPLHSGVGTGTATSKPTDNVLQDKINTMWINQSFGETVDMLIIYKYSGPDITVPANYDAQRFPASTLEFGDLGGAADEPLSMPFTIHYGGTLQHGYANISGGKITFVPATAEKDVKKATEKKDVKDGD